MLCDCYIAFKQFRFPRLIELCGTSDALEALKAAHSEDDLSRALLAHLVEQGARAHQAVAELFSQDELGVSTLTSVATNDGPMEVLEIMIKLAELDVEKRNILNIATITLCRPLHLAAANNPDPAAIKLLVRRFPPALLAKSITSGTPLDYAIQSNKSPAVVALVRKLAIA